MCRAYEKKRLTTGKVTTEMGNVGRKRRAGGGFTRIMATSEEEVNRQHDDDSDGVEFVCAGEGETVLAVGSGRYEFGGRMARG
jgi:hypothetical protein